MLVLTFVQYESWTESNAYRKPKDEVIKQLLSNVHDLSHSEIKQLESLLSEFSDVILTGKDDLGKTKLVYHEIDTGDVQPIQQSARRLPFHQKEEYVNF